MPRITPDDLNYCVQFNQCLDCYREEKSTKAVAPLLRQKRGNLQVPCCQEHFEEYKRKVKQATAMKYARRVARRQKAGLCAYHGCNNQLIPPELLPSWRRDERTCGRHGTFNPAWLNRVSIFKLILDHCLTPEQRKIARLQSIIYKRGSGLVFARIQYPKYSTTDIWPMSELKRLHKTARSKKALNPALPGATS